MSKIPLHNEDHIDNIMIPIADKLCPMFKKLKYTPNGITTISLLFALAAIYNLGTRNITMFSLYYSISYFFDVMDGHYARKYNMKSENGDKYDHFKDVSVVLVIGFILFDKYELKNFPVVMIILFTLLILMNMMLGCREKIAHPDDASNTLRLTKLLAPSAEKCEKRLKWMRFFGSGNSMIITIMIIWYLNYSYNNKHMLDLSNIPYNELLFNEQL